MVQYLQSDQRFSVLQVLDTILSRCLLQRHSFQPEIHSGFLIHCIYLKFFLHRDLSGQTLLHSVIFSEPSGAAWFVFCFC